MKKALLWSGLLFAAASCTSQAKAQNWDYWALKSFDPFDSRGLGLYTVDSVTGQNTLRSTICFPDPGINACKNNIGANTGVDARAGTFVLENIDNELWEYDLTTNSWTNNGSSWTSNYSNVYGKPTVEGGAGGSINVGIGEDIIFSKKVNAAGEEELHIGENSLVTVESNGVQKLYATDANGKKIPINVTEGSDLQINGVSVQGQLDKHTTDIQSNTTAINKNSKAIDSLEDDVNALGSGVAGAAALSAALSALPTVSDDAPFSCGVGTGGYSSRYAMGVGCAARLNERLSFNAGGSVLFGGASNYGSGSLDTVAGRAGFVFKLGQLAPSSTVESNAQLQSKLKQVENHNAEMAYQLESLQQRLNQLEALATGLQQQKAVATTLVP